MASLGAYLRLFRWSNLLIMAATQTLFRYAIILPVFSARGVSPLLTHLDFLLLVLSTLMISAAAYAINDYFDLRIDRINKPQRIILGKKLSRRDAILAHTLLNITGVGLGIYLSFRIGYWPLIFVFLFVPALLWLYSIRYKRKFLVGNLVVAFLAAFVVAIVWIVEYRSMVMVDPYGIVMKEIGFYARIFAFFAFFLTLIREIIKDAEDVHGDSKAGCRTIPVVAGIPATRRLLVLLIVFMLSFVGYAQYLLWQEGFHMLFLYLLLLVLIPLIGLLIQGLKTKSKDGFRRMQQIAKFIMITGILSMLFLSFYL